MKKPKVVAPAGNLEKLKTVCLYGADEIYLGGQEFNLRMATENFSPDEIKEGVDFAHGKGVKVQVLLNSFLHENELSKLPSFLKILEEFEVDGVVVSDFGVLNTVRERSRIPLILSTQGSCANSEQAKFWKRNGVFRIVLGREITVKEAGIIKQKAGVEVELFIHGAMCMGWSGNCYLSTYLEGRDSNRGGCCQACRFHYDMEFEENPVQKKGISFLSSKDLNGISLIPLCIEHEIDALKIEGRMKSSLYAATLTKAYASAIKSCWERGVVDLDILSETKKMKHRSYCHGGLAGVLDEKTVDYEETGPDPYIFIGTVMEVLSSEDFVVHIKNPFYQGDELEGLTFEGENIFLKTENVRDLKGDPVAKAKPNSLLVFKSCKPLAPYQIVRKKLI